MNIYLKVYLDKNFGDDLMLYQFVNYFSKQQPNYVIYIHCEEYLFAFYSELLFGFKNIKIIQCRLRQIEKYGKAFFDCIVLLGGSVLMGNRYIGCWYRFLNCQLLDKVKKNGTNYAIIGCNTGPFKNRIMEYFVKLEIQRADLITTRDNASFDYLNNIVKRKIIYHFPDILFSLSNMLQKDININARALGIAVHGPTREKYFKFLVELCERYISLTNNKIKLLCFDVGAENDIVAADMIYNLVSQKNKIDIVYHESNFHKIIDALRDCDRIITIRFHAAIIASIMKIPFITLSYSNKTRNFMYDINEIDKDFPVDSLNKTTIQTVLKKLFDDPVIVKNDIGINYIGHFKQLEMLLEQKH